jgi:hypothetical protein
MEVRSAETRWEDPAADLGSPQVQATGGSAVAAVAAPDAATAARSQRKPVQRVFLLSRAQEIAYIRSDLRRLILIAGVLLVFMIILLFIVE